MKETETQKAIEDEAKELYPDGGNFAILRRQGFVAGRSKSLEEKEKEIGDLKEALEECEEYFESRADADHNGENFVPNKEMTLLSMIRKLLKYE